MSTLFRLLSVFKLRAAPGCAGARLFGGSGAPGAMGASLRSTARFTARVRVLAVVGLIVGVGLSLAARAQAKLVSYGTIASGLYTGQFAGPQGVTVDQASHDVYVSGVSGAVPGLYKFDASGSALSPPSPFGAGSGGYSSIAINPTNGDVYVRDLNEGSIETYDPSSGAQIGPPCVVSGSGAEQIASDGAGNVYVPNSSGNAIQELSSACAPVQTFTGSGASTLSGPTGVAVDLAGNVWVADKGNNRIEEFGPAGAVISSIASPGVEAVAVDAMDDVFALDFNSVDSCAALASPCAHVVEYSASGSELDDIAAGSIKAGIIGGFFGVNNTLAVDDTSGKVYVSDEGSNLVWVFAPPTRPAIDRELAEQVTASGATLGARINPGGADTSYHFDYGTTTAYDHSAPVPDGDAGSGVQPRTAWATATGLAAGTTYHYRVVAKNSQGTVTGPDETFTTAAAGCPNDRFRTGASAGLPDCRAYEMVTPPAKDSGAPGNLVLGPENLQGYQVAPDGNGVTFFSRDTFPGSPTNGGSYLASRGAGGWDSQNLIPPQSGEYGDRCTQSVTMVDFTTDLSMGILQDGGGGSGCGSDDPPLVPGEPQGVQNLFLRDNTRGTYQLVDLTPAGVTPTPVNNRVGSTIGARFDAASADLTHVVFNEPTLLTGLTPDAPAGADNLYEWTGGRVRLVSYVPAAPATTCGPGGPACTPVVGSLVGGGQTAHAVSSDGSKIFFTAGGNLYMRENGTKTVQLDASQAGGAGGGVFQTASVDGSRVLFTDAASAGLTGDTVSGSGANLYSYNTNTGQLTDLTPQATVNAGSVLGASGDGAFVYFTAGGVLAAGGTSGKLNVYLYHNGTTTFVASPANLGDASGGVPALAKARVSANGRFLAFTSTDSLTGYDTAGRCTLVSDPDLNNDPVPVYGPGGNCHEIYLYDSTSGQLSCASCNPDGDPPYGGSFLTPPESHGEVDFAGALPRVYAPNSVSDTGQVFFDTPDALLPADTNGTTEDVYEYDAGHLHLISGGSTQDNAWFANATANGSDVFLLTSQQLLPQDGDTSPDLYDARVDGGFAPPPAAAASACSGDACRPGSGVAPPPPLAASVGFSGPGNGSASKPTGRVRIVGRVVHGSRFRVRVAVPGKGRITITGAGIRTVRRSVPRAGTYHVSVRLARHWQQKLKRKRRLRLKLHVRYVPAGGQASGTIVALTDKR